MREFKQGLTEVLVETVGPIGDKMREYEQNLDYVEQVLKEGGDKASELANKNMAVIKEKVGLV
jgi:tryptophanyl-tRNA synthetase